LIFGHANAIIGPKDGIACEISLQLVSKEWTLSSIGGTTRKQILFKQPFGLINSQHPA
jgi:hypothetical protein